MDDPSSRTRLRSGPGTGSVVTGLHRPRHPVRFVTAASLFDGHDAAINIMRRLLQSQGAEVIHLGHNRSVDQVVRAAVDEDVQGVAVSSYQGGHMEYFRYLVDRLREEGRGDILVYGGGGGVIVPSEIDELEAYGVRRIFSPSDGQRLGLDQMINLLIEECDRDLAAGPPPPSESLQAGDHRTLARWITHIEADTGDGADVDLLRSDRGPVPVLGITGTGGSGKSSLTDELIRRFRLDQEDKLSIAVLAVDPTRRRGGGALLGDRIRMNAIDAPNLFFRSVATRGSASELPARFPLIVGACAAAGFDLVIVETPGIGQGDAAVVEIADVSLYVMTPEYGAASQLEKIDMLELADAVAINKFDRRGADDAFRQVCRQWARDHRAPPGQVGGDPVFGTIASRFNDDGVTALFHRLKDQLATGGLAVTEGVLAPVAGRQSSQTSAIVPANRRRYLAEIAEAVEAYHATTGRLADQARRAEQVAAVAALGRERGLDTGDLGTLAAQVEAEQDPEGRRLLEEWDGLRSTLAFDAEPDPRASTGSTTDQPNPRWRTSLSGNRIPRVALPRVTEPGELVRWLRSEHLPGHFPFTAGVFPFKREGEDPARMFAGEGDAFRTNRRFHLLAEGLPATRLSTAFDSVTLYGFDPDERPDIYGKIGTSGVS
ncbi:MAG TPA: methylmalonyl-CoA mutase family protein, partial [Acidimicrobiales bacterium]